MNSRFLAILLLAAAATAAPSGINKVKQIPWTPYSSSSPNTLRLKTGAVIEFAVSQGANVVEVPQYVFNACESTVTTVPEVSDFGDGLATYAVSFPRAGVFYFISSVNKGAHCAKGGLRLSIIVEEAKAEAEEEDADAAALRSVSRRAVDDGSSGDGSGSGDNSPGSGDDPVGPEKIDPVELFMAVDLDAISNFDREEFESSIKGVLSDKLMGIFTMSQVITNVKIKDIPTRGVISVKVTVSDSDAVREVQEIGKNTFQVKYQGRFYRGYDSSGSAKRAFDLAARTTTRRRKTTTTTTTTTTTEKIAENPQAAQESGGGGDSGSNGSSTTTVVVVICIVAVVCIVAIGIVVNRKTAKDRVSSDFTQQSSLSRMNFQNPVYENNVQQAAAPGVADPFYYSIQRKTSVHLDSAAEMEAEFEA